MHLLYSSNGRIFGIDLAQPVQVRAQRVGIPVLLGITCQASKSFGLIGIDQKNLLPVLRCQVHAVSSLKRTGLSQKDLDAALVLRGSRRGRHKRQYENQNETTE